LGSHRITPSLHFSELRSLASFAFFNGLNFLNDLNDLNLFLRLPPTTERAVELNHSVEFGAARAGELELRVKELLISD
jgi:hypothetical protein